MRRPPKEARQRAVVAIRLEMLRPTPPITLVDGPFSALGDLLPGTSAVGINHLYLNPTFDAETGILVRRVSGHCQWPLGGWGLF